jgi:hypothetical protein
MRPNTAPNWESNLLTRLDPRKRLTLDVPNRRAAGRPTGPGDRRTRRRRAPGGPWIAVHDDRFNPVTSVGSTLHPAGTMTAQTTPAQAVLQEASRSGDPFFAWSTERKVGPVPGRHRCGERPLVGTRRPASRCPGQFRPSCAPWRLARSACPSAKGRPSVEADRPWPPGASSSRTSSRSCRHPARASRLRRRASPGRRRASWRRSRASWRRSRAS